MALKDCIEKLRAAGVPLNQEDIALLESYIDGGLSDAQAVQTMLILADKDIIDITARARRQGAAVQNAPDTMASIVAIQDKQLQQVQSQRAQVERELADIETRLADLAFVRNAVEHWEGDSLGYVPPNDDQKLMQRISAMFFRNPELWKQGWGDGLIRGSTPLEAFASYKQVLETQAEVRREMDKTVTELSALMDRQEALTGQRPRLRDTFFQDELGFTSGLATAIRSMPMNKVKWEQLNSWLQKQPGVAVAKRPSQVSEDAVDFESFLPEADFIDLEAFVRFKGTVTKDELVEYVEQNGIQLEEIQLGVMEYEADASVAYTPQEQLSEAYFDEAQEISGEPDLGYLSFWVAEERNSGEFYFVVLDNNAGNVYVKREADDTYLEVGGQINSQNFHDADRAIAEDYKSRYQNPQPFDGPAAHGSYTMGGEQSGENYREIILKLPEVAPPEEIFVGGRMVARDDTPDAVAALVNFFEEVEGQGLIALDTDMELGGNVPRDPDTGVPTITFTNLKNDRRGPLAAIADKHGVAVIEDRQLTGATVPVAVWDARVSESWRQLTKEERAQINQSLVDNNHVQEKDKPLGFNLLRQTGELTPGMIGQAGFMESRLWNDLFQLRQAEKFNVQPGLRRDFTGGHFQYNNIVAWFRTKDHLGPNGERILVIEEVQSDWHQEARKGDGYEGRAGLEAMREAMYAMERARFQSRDAYREATPALRAIVDALHPELGAFERGKRMVEIFTGIRRNPDNWVTEISADIMDETAEYRRKRQMLPEPNIEQRTVDEAMTPENIELIEAAVDTEQVFQQLEAEYLRFQRDYKGLPDAPFKDNYWVQLVAKRAMRMAVEQGYDQIAWTPGEVQANRYGQRVQEQVSKIEYDPNAEVLLVYDLEGRQIRTFEDVSPDKLRGIVGVEMANDFQSQIAELDSRWQILPAELADMGNEQTEMFEPPFATTLDPEQIPNMYVAIDPNGEVLRNQYGAIIIRETEQDMQRIAKEWTFEFSPNPEIRGENLVVGGRAMQNFYDNTFPRALQKSARKHDKGIKYFLEGTEVNTADGFPYSVEMRMVGTGLVDGPTRKPAYFILDKRGRAVRGPIDTEIEANEHVAMLSQYVTKVHVMPITDKLAAGVLTGQTLFQRKRGSITFDEARKAYIQLGQAANFDTLVHEAGHLYLELLRSLAENQTPNEDIASMWAEVLKFLGVESGREITREHHEKFADGFLIYVGEGKAPSVGLQDAFAAMLAWLKTIWRRITQRPDVQLTPEIRQVFDKILASDQEIATAEAQQEYAALFVDRDAIGMSPEAFAVYQKQVMRAHNEGVEKQTVKAMQDLRKAEQEWYDQEAEKVRAEVEAEAHEMPVYIALAKLQKDQLPNGEQAPGSKIKLNGDQLKRRYGKSFTSRLPKPWVYSKEGGLDLDVAAQYFGFKDADEMTEALIKAPRMDEYIKAETNARMQERYPDRQLDGTLMDEAIEVVHNDRRAEVLATEMRALRKLVREDRPIVRAHEQAKARERREQIAIGKSQIPKRQEMKMFRIIAAEHIAGKKIRDVMPHKYLAAERKNARLAFEAMQKNDIEGAYHYKLKQLRNFEMYRASVKARKQVESAQRYLSKFEKPRVRQRLGKAGVLDQIDGVLDSIDFRKLSLAEVDRIELAKTLRDQVESGEIVATPELVKRLEAGTNWQQLTVEEMIALKEVIQQIEHMADRQQYVFMNGVRMRLEDVTAELTEQMYENNQYIDMGLGEERFGAQWKRWMKQGVAAWLRPSSIARILDKAGFGALTRLIIVPMRRAYSERLIPMLHKAQADVAEIYNRHYTPEELGQLKRKKFDTQIQGETFSKSDLLSMALNWGNEGNRSAVLAGRKRGTDGEPGPLAYSEEGVKEMLSMLDARDWAFVQDMWDYFDSYYPELAEAEKRRRGVAPQRVEASPFTIRTADNQTLSIKGGYYPLAYDARHSDRVKVDEYEDAMRQMSNGVYVSANTRAGATYERTNQRGRVVKLSLTVIDTKLRELIRDLAIGDEVQSLKQIINDRGVRDSFVNTGNEVALETLNLWLTDAAVGELPAEGFYEKSMNYIRTGFTKSKLAWNLLTTLLQFTGIAQSAAVIGSANYARGMGRFLLNPKQQWKHVMETSRFLQTRYEVGAWDKDVMDTRAHLEAFFGPAPTKAKTRLTALSYTYFLPIMRAQQVVDVTTWLGAYEKGRNELELSDADAVIYADTQVEAAQTSGFFSDRSGLERGTLGRRKVRQAQALRIWTTLISYMLAKGNIAYEKGKATNFRKPSDVAKFAADLVLLFTVEGILSAIIYGQWPEEDDEPEDWAMWGVSKTLESVTAGIPFIREVPGSRFGGGTTPVGAFAHDLYDLGQQIGQGEADEAARKAFINALGVAAHLPASQTNRMIDVIWSEDDPEWYEYIFGEQEE